MGITWSPQEKPNQASTKLSASFVCTQNTMVEIPLCLRLIIYCYLTTGNHDPGECSGGSKVTPGAIPPLGSDLLRSAEEETGKINSDWWLDIEAQKMEEKASLFPQNVV